MKKLFWLFGLCCWLPLMAGDDTQPLDEGTMLQWESYASYFNPTDAVITQYHVFELAGTALFSVDKRDGSITRWNKGRGMHGGEISRIAYIKAQDAVLVVYNNNMIDIISSEGEISDIPDLFQSSTAITIQTLCIHNHVAFIGTNFGIIELNLIKKEVADTYYIGPNASSVSITELAIANDTLFALSGTDLYKGSLKDQLINYNHWTIEPSLLVAPIGMVSYQDSLWLIDQEKLYERVNGEWIMQFPSASFVQLKAQANKLFITDGAPHLFEINDGQLDCICSSLASKTGVFDTQTQHYWLAGQELGLIEWNKQTQQMVNHYIPDGPIRNDVYHLQFAGEKLFICPGTRWSVQGNVSTTFAFYKNGEWGYETDWHTQHVLNDYPTDLLAVAVDPNDDSHFYMSCYGHGVLEYRNNQIFKQYTEGVPNCSLLSLVENNLSYVRTDAATMDNGYLWILQPENRPYTINVMNIATGQWAGYNFSYKGQRITSNTVKGIWIDSRNSQYKWFINQRGSVGICLINDNGTPMKGNDDRYVFRSEMLDQNNENFTLTRINELAQDRNGDFWVAMQGGVFIIPTETDFFSSNACKRIIIPRNDGTGLADYLLANDNVTAIAVDGGNRKWLGTENSGVYLVSEDGMTTIHHFTIENSALLSNNITSIAIHPTSGEVFIGTTAGLVSYRSDSAEPFETYADILAYPNPVRPNYDGVVTITGLMDQTDVNIIDQAGQLVCKTSSNGGIAIWDLRNGAGQRVSSGVYTALCNAPDGKHGMAKILVMNR